MRRLISIYLPGTLALCVPLATFAQSPVVVDRAASDGVDRPIHDISGEADASSLELNPALLSAIRGIDFVVRGYVSNDTFGRGDGVGGFFALGVRGFAAAFGAQALRPGFDDGQFDAERSFHPDAVKVSGGVALGDPERSSLGIGVSRIHGGGSGGLGWLRRPDLDIGLISRVTNYAALGLTARMSPSGLSEEATRSFFTFDSELAIRPLGTRWLELAGGVRARVNQADGDGLSGLGGEDLMPHGRIALRYQGLTLAGEIEQVPMIQLDEETLEIEGRGMAVRGALNLGLNWDYLGIEIGSHAGPNRGITGTGFAMHMSTDRQGRAFWLRPTDVERVELSSVRGERKFLSLLRRVQRATDAGSRSVLLLDCRDMKLGWASLQELRGELVRARNAGVHLFAYMEGAGLDEYYLASVAEQVYLHTIGELTIHGLSSTGVYFNNLLETLGVRVEALHIKEYKSAHERLSRSDRSKYDREQREAMMTTIYDTAVHDIAQGRGLTLAQVRDAIDEAPHGPQRAVELGLIDEVVHRDEVLTHIGETIGMPVEYKPFRDGSRQRETWSRAPYFAIVPVVGTIADGDSQQVPFLNLQFAGGDSIAKTLKQVREDPACKGVVLRVNSPGGSALASEIIWREVQRTHDAHERDDRSPPIVVSMGDLAASGGYYVSMGAPKIFAQPTTITGSIGVVSIHFDIQNLLEVLGIGVDTITKGKYADIGSFYRHFSDEEKKRLEDSMFRIYEVFTGRVADNRGMTKEKVNELGRGHVYSGADAKALGLVDEFGGLREAVDYLRKEAGVRKLPPVELRVFPRYTGLLGLIFNELGDAGKKIELHRDAAKAKKSGMVPKFVSAAVARLPLSLLFLPQGEAQLIVDQSYEIR
jgi:protease-4